MASKSPTKASRIPMESIQLDGDTQSRARIDTSVVEDYAEQLKAGAKFPPITLYFDGETHWIGDGFHRAHAYVLAKRKVIPAEVHQGDRRAAILCAVGANDTHGLRRSNEDKRRAVKLLLDDPEWSQKSDNWIASQCRVSHTLVSNIRASTCNVASSPPENSGAKRQCLDGKNRDVSSIGTCRKPLTVQPNMPRTDRDEGNPRRAQPMPAERPAPEELSHSPQPEHHLGNRRPSSPMGTVECMIVQLQNPMFRTEDGKGALKHLGKWCLDQFAPLTQPDPDPIEAENSLEYHEKKKAMEIEQAMLRLAVLVEKPRGQFGYTLKTLDPNDPMDGKEVTVRQFTIIDQRVKGRHLQSVTDGTYALDEVADQVLALCGDATG